MKHFQEGMKRLNPILIGLLVLHFLWLPAIAEDGEDQFTVRDITVFLLDNFEDKLMRKINLNPHCLNSLNQDEPELPGRSAIYQCRWDC